MFIAVGRSMLTGRRLVLKTGAVVLRFSPRRAGGVCAPYNATGQTGAMVPFGPYRISAVESNHQFPTAPSLGKGGLVPGKITEPVAEPVGPPGPIGPALMMETA